MKPPRMQSPQEILVLKVELMGFGGPPLLIGLLGSLEPGGPGGLEVGGASLARKRPLDIKSNPNERTSTNIEVVD